MVGYTAALVVIGTVVGVGCSVWKKNKRKNLVPIAEKAVGKGGRVYKKIPRLGQGIISVAIDGKLVEFTAQSHDGTAIPSFTPVQVISAIDNQTVTVAPITLSPNAQ